MGVAVFDTHAYDRQALETKNLRFEHALTFLEPRLTQHTAPLAAGFSAICSFVNDRVDTATLGELQRGGTRLIALRSAGYNQLRKSPC